MGPLCHGLGNEGMRCCQLRYEVFDFFFLIAEATRSRVPGYTQGFCK